MIIRESQVNLSTNHKYQEQRQVRDQWLPRTQQSAPSETSARPTQLFATTSQRIDLSASMSAEDRLQLQIIARLFLQLTGREMKIAGLSDLSGQSSFVTVELPRNAPSNVQPLVYERTTRYEESEKLQFAAYGQVKTQEGRSINFLANLKLERHYLEETTQNLINGNAIMRDPLVINFDGTGADLSSTTFAFDIDNDGTPEQIANLRPNSGYLALDRNNDGMINNGSELFGPNTNNGFTELAEFDEDGNGFIDEGDSIYHQLRIWQRTDSGESRLLALGDKQIGAIYLGHTLTPFQLKDSNNNSLGEIVSSGVYLREDGSSGIVQQINLAI